MGNNTSAAGAHEVEAPISPQSDEDIPPAPDLSTPPSSTSPTIDTNNSSSGAVADLTECLDDISLTRSDLEVHTEVKICDPEKEAPIQINVTITSSKTNEVVRYAGVHFNAGGSDIRDQSFSVHTASLTREVKRDTGEKAYPLRFKYTAAVVFGVDFVPTGWSHEVRNAIEDLRNYLSDGEATVILDPAHGDFDVDTAIARLKPVFDGKAQTLIDKYTHTCQGRKIGSLSSYTQLLEDYGPSGSHPMGIGKKVASIPSTHAFSCPEEAVIKLAHGRFIDYKYEMMVSNNLFKGFFRAVFLVASSKRAVIACVRKVDGVWDNEDRQTKLAMSDKMAVSIIYAGSSYDQGRNGDIAKDPFGNLTLNHTPVRCDFVLLMDAKQIPDNAVARARPFSDARDICDKDFFTVDLVIKDYEQAKLQINAINWFFDRSGVFRQWWPAFMGVPDGWDRTSNWLKEQLGVTQTKIDAVVDGTRARMAKAGMVLNSEQDDIIRSMGQTHHGWTLWRGPPGTGKSTTIALMAHSLLQFEGIAVYACAPSNGAASKLFGSIKQWMQLAGVDDPTLLPLRVFRKYHERRHIISSLFPTYQDTLENGKKKREPQPVFHAAQLEEDDWYTRQLLAENKRLMDDPDNGLMAAVLKAVKDGNFHEQALARTSDGPRDGRHIRQMKHFREARASLVKLQAKMKNQSIWYDDKEREKYVADVRNQVLGERRCVVSTVNNATSLLLRDAVFRDSKAVVIIVDEQSLDTDASTIGLLAGLISEERTMHEFGGRPPVVQMILVGDDKQGRPVVKSAQEGLNIFGDQARLSTFERLIQLGMPVHTLFEQRRMAPILRELPSERCYGGQLRDSSETQRRLLNLKQIIALAALFGKNQPDADQYADPYAYLRLKFFDVQDSECRFEALTKSRYNTANLEVTLSLVAYLVKKQVIQPQEIVILTLYNAQKKQYLHRLGELEHRLGLARGTFDDTVETSDSFQGRERKCVILDLVVTSYTGATSLGNVGDERRMNVACTRARDLFFVVGTMRLLETRERFTGRMEYVMALLQRFRERKAIKTGKAMELKAKLAI